MKRPPLIAFAYLAALAVVARPLRAQEVTLEVVMARAAAYVAGFKQQFSGLVAEEHYVQDVRQAMGSRSTSGGLQEPIPHRELRSDILLVRLADPIGYVEFRDVFEVDGMRVRDRQERLARLFLDTSQKSASQLERIVSDSSRYNIGSVVRTINTPIVPLMFLEREYQPRFTFTQSTARPISTLGIEKTRFGSDVWVVDYQEQARNTIIRRANSAGDMPAHGRFWLDPATGRVLMTELLIDDPVVRTMIDVVYKEDAGVKLWVPGEMRERYNAGHDHSTVEGRATYEKFRRFGVSTDETIDAPRR